MIRFANALMVIVPLLTPAIAFAQDSLSIRLLGEMANLAENPRIQIDGSLMIVSAESGLILVDITDPERPVSRNILTRLDPRGNSYTPPFAFAGGLLVVAWHEFISTYRIESFDRVIPLGRINLDNHWCNALATDGSVIYARVSTRGIVVIDASEADLREVGSVDPGQYCRDMLVENNLQFTFGNDTTCIIDVTNPAQPVLTALLPPVVDLEISGENAFLLTRDSLRIFDISSPDRPELLATRFNNGREYNYAQAISVDGDRVAIAFDGGKVKLYELDGDLNLNQSGEFRTPTRWPRDCRIWGDWIISAGGIAMGTVTIIDASDPANMHEDSEIGISEHGSSAIFINDYLICPSDTSISTTYRVNESGQFQRVYRGYEPWDEEGGYFTGGIVIGDAVYEPFFGIRIWDCSDPMNIRFGATADWPENREIRFFEGNESLAVLAWRDSTMEILSTDDPYDPHSIGRVDFQGDIFGIGLGDSVAYAAVKSDSVRLYSIDLHRDRWLQISNPVTMGVQRYVYWTLPVFNNLLFAVYYPNCRVFDVSNPLNIREVATIDSLRSVYGVWDRILYSHWAGGIRALDMSDPMNPIEVARFDDERQFNFRAFENGRLLATYGGGIALFELEEFANSIVPETDINPERFSLSSYPNPFNSRASITMTLPSRVKGELLLVDPLGRVVRRLTPNSWFEAGSHRLQFNGDELPSGSYRLVFDEETGSVSRQVILQR